MIRRYLWEEEPGNLYRRCQGQVAARTWGSQRTREVSFYFLNVAIRKVVVVVCFFKREQKMPDLPS